MERLVAKIQSTIGGLLSHEVLDVQVRETIKQRAKRRRVRCRRKSAFKYCGSFRVREPGGAVETTPVVRRPGNSGFIYHLRDKLRAVKVMRRCYKGKKQPDPLVLINHQSLLSMTTASGGFFRRKVAEFQ